MDSFEEFQRKNHCGHLDYGDVEKLLYDSMLIIEDLRDKLRKIEKIASYGYSATPAERQMQISDIANIAKGNKRLENEQ